MQLPVKTTQELVVQSAGDETLIYHRRSHRVHRLSRTAMFVWEHCDGVTTVGQAAAELSVALGRPVQDEVIEFAVENLARAELVECPSAVPSRRSMLRRLGWTGAAAALLPLVTTVLSPQPAAAQSNAAPPDPCQAPTDRPRFCPCQPDLQGQCGFGMVCTFDGQQGFICDFPD